jgi:hypothetical protein
MISLFILIEALLRIWSTVVIHKVGVVGNCVVHETQFQLVIEKERKASQTQERRRSYKDLVNEQ